MSEKKILSNIKKFRKYLENKKNIGSFVDDGLGYHYDKEIIEMIAIISEESKYKDIYIPNLKSLFQNGDLSNLSFEMCITYFKWLWTAERMAAGTIIRQIKNKNFETVLNLIEMYFSNKTIREQLQFKYYINWNGSRTAFKELTRIERIKMYDSYIDKIEQFMDEINWIKKNDKTLKMDFNPNYRQLGGYERCMSKKINDWDTKEAQFGQRYKELMIDYLYYNDELKYDDMSLKELTQIEEMARFLLEVAINNKENLEAQSDPNNYINKVKLSGFLTKKPEVRKFESGNICSTFVLAVKRNYKNSKGKYDEDYICIICWNDVAKDAQKYFADDFIEIEGHIQTRSYINDKNENKFVTEVYCTSINSEQKIRNEFRESIIELKNENIEEIIYDDIIAVTIAEAGAMGEPNGFYAVNKEHKLYHLNFGETSIEKETLYEKFPLLVKLNCFFEEVSNLDMEWKWFNMGFGNYLVVRDSIYSIVKKYIKENLKEDYEHGELYNKWYEVIKNVTQNNMNNNDSENGYDVRTKIIESLGLINLTKDNISLIDEKNVLFIETSNDGSTYIMDNKKQLFYVDLEYGKEITKEEFNKYFSKYAKSNVENTKYYKSINLGLGHALLIKTNIFDEYLKLLKENIVYENEYEDCYNAYCHWMESAISFVNK